jgi:hypothetical protein
MNAGETAPEWATLVTTTSATGVFTDTTTSITGKSTYTKTIALGVSANHGNLWIYGTYDNTFAHIVFDTNIAHSISFCRISNTAGSGMTALTGNTQITNGYFGSTGGNPWMQSCRINGTNLEIVFYNDNAGAATLSCSAFWEVWV